MKKMTKREVLNFVKDFFEKNEVDGDVTSADVVAFVENEIGLLDNRAEKAKERAEKKKAEGDALKEVIFEALTEDFATIPEILTAVNEVNDEELTAGKVVARLKKLVDEGAAEKTTLTVGEVGNKRQVVAYKRV